MARFYPCYSWVKIPPLMHIGISFLLVAFYWNCIPFNILSVLRRSLLNVLCTVFVFSPAIVCVFVGDTPIGYIEPPVLTLSFVIKLLYFSVYFLIKYHHVLYYPHTK